MFILNVLPPSNDESPSARLGQIRGEIIRVNNNIQRIESALLTLINSGNGTIDVEITGIDQVGRTFTQTVQDQSESGLRNLLQKEQNYIAYLYQQEETWDKIMKNNKAAVKVVGESVNKG